jgi:hypothetical protein
MGLYQKGSQSQPDTIFIVGGVELFPYDPGHDPEHGPSIQAKKTVCQGIYFELTQLHSDE